MVCPSNVQQAFLVTWTVHLNCAKFKRVCPLCITALLRTSVSGIQSCHLTFRSFLVWTWFNLLACRYCQIHMRIVVLAAPRICRLSALYQVWFNFDPKYDRISTQSAKCCTSFGNSGIDTITNVHNSRRRASCKAFQALADIPPQSFWDWLWHHSCHMNRILNPHLFAFSFLLNTICHVISKEELI